MCRLRETPVRKQGTDNYYLNRNKERMMQQHLKEEISSINVENMRQKQLLVNEFVQAQELLKEKISETEKA